MFWTACDAAGAAGANKAPRAGFQIGFAARTLLLLLVAVSAVVQPALAKTPEAGAEALFAKDTVALEALPPEARKTHRLILAGGPFPYDKDGTVFFNRERLLPQRPRGHYREYTVKTPGARNRGARRIVCGGVPPVQPEVCYYTADHYASFKRIQP